MNPPPVPPPPAPPPQKKKDDIDYYVIGAVIAACVGVVFCLVNAYFVLLFIPALATLAAFIAKRANAKIAAMRAETDHLLPYQRIVDIETEVIRIREKMNTEIALKNREIAGLDFQTQKLRTESAALINRIEGYGDDYVLPTHDLVEELAENYGHTAAGEKLKTARAHTKSIIKQRRAIICTQSNPDIVKALERVFIVAFNGDTEETLNRAKHDNYGKLAQEMKDAHAIINKNGEVFGTTITNEYLNARIDELRWVVIAHELKKREADEQRELRERAREEERAQREIAKAQAETEKAAREARRIEAEAHLKADLARAELEKARASAENETRIRELTAALNEAETRAVEADARAADAEARNQRAISMAQQTKAGTVYIISNIGSFGENVFKIGMTRREKPEDRVYELSDASVPFDFDVHAMIPTNDAPGLENRLHKQFAKYRLNKVNLRKEFFGLTAAEIRNALGAEIENTTFTLLAEAKEYRESLALAKQVGIAPKVSVSVF